MRYRADDGARLSSIGYKLRRSLLQRQWFTSTLLPTVPRPLRWGLRKAYFLPFDLMESVLGRRDKVLPPKSAIYTGSVDDFRRSGDALVARLAELGGLTPESRVLDVGSGMGRAAIALTSCLDSSGSYEGMDIVPSGVEWCVRNITNAHPRFQFVLADIYNKEYNPTGSLRPTDFPFPYGAGQFDLVILASVFTHMLPDDMDHYLSEISRVLKPGGRCYASFSLLDEESQETMLAGGSSLRFKPHSGGAWVVDPKVPELAVAYEAEYAQRAFERHELASDLRIYHGSWSPRSSLASLPPYSQDIIVASKNY